MSFAAFATCIRTHRPIAQIPQEFINKQDDFSGSTLLHYAASYKNGAAMLLLLERGADPNIKDKLQETPLMKVSGSTYFQSILINHGADINSQDRFGFTLFHKLVQHNSFTGCEDEGAVDYLLKKGADYTICSFDGKSPVSYLTQNRKDEILQKYPLVPETKEPEFD